MNPRQINEQAQAILLGLNGYSERDIFLILTAAISLAISQPDGSERGLSNGAGCLFRPGGRRLGGKIDRCPEIRAFLYNIDHYMTLVELHTLLEEKFGKVRAPSKSALSRFFRKLEGRKKKYRMQDRKKSHGEK